MFFAYPYNQELGNKYIININNRMIRISEILVVYFVRQNLVLGFVGQSLAFSLVEYFGFSIKGFVFECPEIISCSLVVK
jgi:hypothetical protein